MEVAPSYKEVVEESRKARKDGLNRRDHAAASGFVIGEAKEFVTENVV
jgi:hypothetical protein